MNVSKLFKDDDAVSPVIGVILMVAITVILAAVIGAFVLNIGGSQASAPQATISWEFNSSLGTANATHQSGEKLPKSEVEYTVDGGAANNLPGDLAAGDTLVVGDTGSAAINGQPSTHTISSGQDIKLIWNSPSSDKSSIISSYTPT